MSTPIPQSTSRGTYRATKVLAAATTTPTFADVAALAAQLRDQANTDGVMWDHTYEIRIREEFSAPTSNFLLNQRRLVAETIIKPKPRPGPA